MRKEKGCLRTEGGGGGLIYCHGLAAHGFTSRRFNTLPARQWLVSPVSTVLRRQTTKGDQLSRAPKHELMTCIPMSSIHSATTNPDLYL